MPLTVQQIQTLQSSIASYNFPSVYYDFRNGRAIFCVSMTAVELAIQGLLLSSSLTDVKNGLSNIIYWGYANSGYRDYRVKSFQNNITKNKLLTFSKLVSSCRTPQLNCLTSIKMPEFSGVSFLSKITMFLKPQERCVLDMQIAKMTGTKNTTRALNSLKMYTTQIPATSNNSNVYLYWCNECAELSRLYYRNRYRPVDIERGFFQLIQSNRLNIARDIYETYK